mgnify:CR=1 FL=1
MRNPPVKNGTDTPLFGLFADLKNRPVLVVGGGQVAQRKVAALRAAGARVRVPDTAHQLGQSQAAVAANTPIEPSHAIVSRIAGPSRRCISSFMVLRETSV